LATTVFGVNPSLLLEFLANHLVLPSIERARFLGPSFISGTSAPHVTHPSTGYLKIAIGGSPDTSMEIRARPEGVSCQRWASATTASNLRPLAGRLTMPSAANLRQRSNVLSIFETSVSHF